MEPDLRKLGHFVAVAEELNFTRAAERLHMSQQALSASVSRLEEELGVPLLERAPRRVELTAAGRSLLGEGRLLLSASRAAWERAGRIGRGEGGVVHVGRTPAVTGEETIAFLRPVQERHPEVLFTVETALPAEMPDRVLAGAFDLAFGRVLDQPDGLAVKVVAMQRLRVAISTAHRLAGRESLHLAELAEDTLVVWSTSSGGTQLLLDVCRRSGFEPRFVVDPVLGGPPVTSVAAADEFALLTAPAGPASAPGVVVLDFEPVTRVPLQLAWPEGKDSELCGEIEAGVAESAGSSID